MAVHPHLRQSDALRPLPGGLVHARAAPGGTADAAPAAPVRRRVRVRRPASPCSTPRRVSPAWWVCRAHPPWRSNPVRTLVTVLVARGGAGECGVGGGGRRVGRDPGDRVPASIPGAPPALADLVPLFLAGVPLYLLSVMAHYMILAFEASRAAERQAFESQVTAREAELRALRAQINPHFLFNSLNSISALAAPDPEAARRMCQLLGDFLRQSLSLGGRERVTLAEELALADRYLAIEQVRFGDRLGVETHAEASALPAAWSRRSCSSRWSRTRSSTGWPTAWRAAPSGSRRRARRTSAGGGGREPARSRRPAATRRGARARERARAARCARPAPHARGRGSLRPSASA